MRKRNLIWLLATFFLTTISLAEAQQMAGKIPRIGYLGSLSPSSDSSRNEAFRSGLKELGYVEEKNIAIEFEFAQGKLDRLPDLAMDLVRSKVEVIVVGGLPRRERRKMPPRRSLSL
jgi:putative ABC transport system substrate-binding protein